MRILVEVSWGIGNMVQGTPLCHALHLLGHKVSIFIHHRGLAEKVAPLFEGWDVLDRVYSKSSDIDYSRYDFGVCCFGERRAIKRLPPGFCIDLGRHGLTGCSEVELNLSAARRLGYDGPVPPSHVESSNREFGLSDGAVVVHAGCDPKNAIKRWRHWPSICQRIKAEGREVVIVGTDADRSDDNWESQYRVEFNLPIRDLAALLNEATLYLGNDSGVGHIAAAVGLPGVLVFGPSDPVKNAPNSRVLRQLVAPREGTEEYDVRSDNPVEVDRVSLEQAWEAIQAVFRDPVRDPDRGLPKSVTPPPPVEPEWPGDQATAVELEDWLADACAYNARRLEEDGDGAKLVREGRDRVGRFHLLLSRKYAETGHDARQANFHAEMAIRCGFSIRGRVAKLRARR